MAINDLDELVGWTVLPFGKYGGMTLDEVAEEDPDYLQWIRGLELSGSGFGRFNSDYGHAIDEALHVASVKKLEANLPEYTLSPGQEAAVDRIEGELLSPAGDCLFRLQGAAGYGKSFATMEVVKRAMRARYRVHACSTSYVATEVLRQQLDPLGVEVGTIASMFRQDRCYDGAREIYEISPESYESAALRFGRGHLVIVDEYSMVNDEVGNFMINEAQAHGGKLLVVGDVGQLPSPSQDHDSVLCGIEPSAALTEPMRYEAGSDLHQVETLVRQSPYEFSPGEWSGSMQIFLHCGWDAFLQAFVETYRAHPTKAIKMLWYRRRDVANANFAIREALFGGAERVAGVVEEDEQVMIMRTTDLPNDQGRVYSGQLYRLSHVEPTEVEFRYWVTVAPDQKVEEVLKVECYRARLGGKTEANLIFAVSETQAMPEIPGGKQFNDGMKHLAELAGAGQIDWSTYHDFRSQFCLVNYSYATTIHRTQGMSADIVFTNHRALLAAQPFVARKLMYVGMTRAKSELHLLVV